MRTIILMSGLTAVCLSLAASAPAWPQALTDSPQAQAMVDEAVATWADGKVQPAHRDLQAKALLEQVVAQYPRTNQAAAALRHLAHDRYLKGRTDQAQTYWDRLSNDYPTSEECGRAWIDHARFLGMADRHRDALPLLDKVVARFPKTDLEPDALYLSGEYLWQTDRPRQALPPLERVVKEYPNTTEALRAHYVLAYIKAMQVTDNPKAAMAHLAIVIAKEDVDPERIAWSKYLTAMCHVRLWDYSTAIAECEEVIRTYSQHPQVIISTQALLVWLRVQAAELKKTK